MLLTLIVLDASQFPNPLEHGGALYVRGQAIVVVIAPGVAWLCRCESRAEGDELRIATSLYKQTGERKIAAMTKAPQRTKE